MCDPTEEEEGSLCARVRACVRACSSLCNHSHPVQPCSCVSRVDVPKWGHFLSVWCLRNNPTAQKLLQPSASTYSSLYLYWSGYAFSVGLLSYSHCLVLHDSTLTAAVWCLLCCSQYEVMVSFLNVSPPVPLATAENPNVIVKSQIWAAMFVTLSV